MTPSRPMSPGLLGLLAAVALLVGCAGGSPEAEGARASSPEPPGGSGSRSSERSIRSVVLVTIDTLRADRCSVYGHDRPTTPRLERLASQGVVFDEVHAGSSWTPPSMASIFTGRPPRAHGVIHGAVRDGGVYGQEYLDESFPILASELSRAGFRCLGVSSNTHLGERTGFARGFDRFVEVFWEDAESVSDAARSLVAGLEAGERYFLWVHYIDPHAPYHARAPWATRFTGDPALVEEWGGTENSELRGLLKARGFDSAALETVRALYDSEVAYVDDALGRLLDGLPDLDEALVVVTSDHGESLGERERLGHGSTLFEEQIRVPLVLAGPGLDDGRRVATPVSNVALLPTLLELLELPVPEELAEDSLASLVRGGSESDRPVVTVLDRNRQDAYTVRLGDTKLYRRMRPQSEIHLFDLARDPSETQNLVLTDDARLVALMSAWREHRARWPVFEPRRVVMGDADSEEAERLRSLGYLGR